jgi:hypothetical protein
VHWLAIVAVTVFAMGAVGFGVFLVAANWTDYKDVLLPRFGRERALGSLKKVDD